MKAKIKKIDNVIPITTTKAVFIDGTNKTLQQAIDNGELGGETEVLVSGRGLPVFCLREYIYIKPIPASIGVGHEFITSGMTNFVRLPGGSMSYLNMPKSVTLNVGQAYVYDYTKNTFEIRGSGTANEYTACSSTEVILYSNYGGVAQGALKDWFVECRDDNIPFRELESEVSSIRTTQGVFVVEDFIYTAAHSNDEHTDFATIDSKNLITNANGKSYTHNLGHLNTCDYSPSRDMLLTGNSSKSYTLVPELFIFKKWKSVLDNNTQLDFNILEKTVISFTEFEGEYKWNFAWGIENDIVWASCCDMRILRKIRLGVTDGSFNGTYTIERTWYSEKSDIIGGIIFLDGHLYAGVKGVFGVRKIILTSGNLFKSEYIKPIGKLGDVQGIQVYNNQLICVSDTNCTKINVDKL